MIEGFILDDDALESATREALGRNSYRLLEEALCIPGETPTYYGVFDQPLSPESDEHSMRLPFILTQTPEEIEKLRNGLLYARFVEQGKEGRVAGQITERDIYFIKAYDLPMNRDGLREKVVCICVPEGEDSYRGTWRIFTDMPDDQIVLGLNGTFFMCRINDPDEFLESLK